MTNKTVEGYPGKRYFGGCQYIDQAEQLAIDRAKKNVWGRTCKCPTPFWIKCKYGGLFFDT